MLRLLKLDDRQVLDQILDNWRTYTTGSTEQVYEATVDDLYELIDMTYRDSDEGIRLQCLLGECQDQLVELMKLTTIRLQQALENIPDQVAEMSRETGEYHFLRVESINYEGKFAVLATDIIDNPL